MDRTAEGGQPLAFSLIEMVGVLAVIAILAALMVPSVVRRMDLAAASSESANLSAMSDALKQYVVRSNSIPDQTQWYNAISSQLGLAPANVTTTPRGYTRVFLIDTAGWLTTALASGPWTQSPGGTAQNPGGNNAPSGARLMIVSTIAKPDLPVSSGKPAAADFNMIWNTPQGAKPGTAAFASWNGNGNDLVIQRINLDPLFHHVILVQGSIGGPSYFSINGSSPASVPTGGAGANTYYLDGSVLGLYDAIPNLMANEIIRGDLSRVFEYGLWRDQVYAGTTNGVLTGLDLLAASFFTSSAPTNAPSGQTPQGVLGLMSSYMSGYISWAAMSPCFSYSGTNGSYTTGDFAPYNQIHAAITNAGVVP